MVSLRVNQVINNMNLVKRDEFDALKRLVQKLIIDNEKSKKPRKKKIIKKKTAVPRKKTTKNHPRTCDIDIIDYDQKVKSINLYNKKITIPHPRMHKRNFVLIPLFEISKNWNHPNFNHKISKLLSNINNNELRSIKII